MTSAQSNLADGGIVAAHPPLHSPPYMSGLQNMPAHVPDQQCLLRVTGSGPPSHTTLLDADVSAWLPPRVMIGSAVFAQRLDPFAHAAYDNNNNKWCKKCDIRPDRRRTRIVQSYFPNVANTLTTRFLGPTRVERLF